MYRVKVGLCLAVLVVSLAACSAPAPSMKSTGSAPAAQSAAPVAPSVARGAVTAAGEAADSVAENPDRMVIRNVEMLMVVGDANATAQEVTRLAGEMGGYVSDSATWRERDLPRARMTVRIPAARLDSALATFRALAVRVDRETVTGKDVTEEFTDLNAQLVNLEATEVELRALLTDIRQRSQKAEEVLRVHQEVARIRGEIEKVKGRIQYLNNQSSMATIRLELTPDVLSKPVVDQGWRPLETVYNAGGQLVRTLQGLGTALIWLVIYWLPFVMLLGLPLWAVVRWWRRRNKRSSTLPATG